MNKKLIIVADDFTGSNDTGVQFSKNGLKTVVITDAYEIERTSKMYDILVVDTESRFDSCEEAYKKTYTIGKSLSKNEHIKFIYKKLDSTLRGNIGAEIAGLMDGRQVDFAIVAPAYPKAGRKVLDGCVFVHDTLLGETEFVNDPKTPVKYSFVPKIIAEQTDKKIAYINHVDVIAGKEDLFNRMLDIREKKAEIIVIDAISDQDLMIIADVISSIKENIIIVGSAGLAEYLPQALNLKKEEKSIILVSGSVSETTRRQIEYLQMNLPVEIIDIDINGVFNDKKNEIKRIKDLCKKIIMVRKDIVIRSSRTRADVQKAVELGKGIGLSNYEVSEQIAMFIGEVTAEILSELRVGGLFLAGGDIAIKVAKAIKATGTIIKDEILPGIPWGYFIHGEYNDLPVVTKAGGFGKDDDLARIINYLKER